MMRRIVFSLMLPLLMQGQSGRIVSPEVGADNRVTFRFRAPGAQKVTVNREPAKPLEMQKDGKGVWSVTTDPLTPDMYGYSFNVDGVNALDPVNPMIRPNLLGPINMLHVRGSNPWDAGEVAHGAVHHHFFHSAVAGDNRDLYVYTPANYDAKARNAYPVLYLLHGFSDDASAWISIGYAHVILDNLIAQGKAKPMVLVMPLGYGTMEILQKRDDPATRATNFERFQESLLHEVMPLVEKTYHVSSDPARRAITGLSVGGGQAVRVGLNHPGEFAWVGGFSAGWLPESFEETFPKLDEKAGARLKLLWIACGKDDNFFAGNVSLEGNLTRRNVKHEWTAIDGGHTWMVWRRNLVSFTQLLFGQ